MGRGDGEFRIFKELSAVGALLFVMGFGGWLHTVFLATLFQTIPTEEIRGRVMSVFGLIGAGFPLGFLLGRALAVTFGFEALSKTSP